MREGGGRRDGGGEVYLQRSKMAWNHFGLHLHFVRCVNHCNKTEY